MADALIDAALREAAAPASPRAAKGNGAASRAKR